MIEQVVAPPVVVIPETAPFAPEQRAWLSGFFAALLTQQPTASAATALTNSEASLLTGAAPTNFASNDDAPWHDPSLAIAERMELADGKPLPQRLMAAMAQQDCGQCGYNCADYANAIFSRSEARLNLCAPGGKDTARKLKELDAKRADAPVGAAALTVADAVAVSIGEKGRCRENPVDAIFLARRRLNGDGSEKETYHVEFDLAASDLRYDVGDSFGVTPRNDLGLVDQIIAMLGAPHMAKVNGRALRHALAEDCSLGAASDRLFELISYLSGGEMRAKARLLARGEDPDGDAANLDVLAALMKFSSVRPHPEAFVEALDPLQPRLYSISSSPIADGPRLSLTIDKVRYRVGARRRLGVASTFLTDRAKPGEHIKVYVQRAHGFAPPVNPSVPMIMIGSGTGVAPFRAFLRHREAIGAEGRNWLFFGHQRQETDFFYREELEAMKQRGALARLSLAWSRDGAQKFYVQDRMRESGAEIWRWLAEGAHFYVCGDAKRMARDVEAALVDIVARHGVRSADDAVAFVQGMKRAHRYQADVY